jgi:16S rRNA (cytosine967-C5)-methyltransferase
LALTARALAADVLVRVEKDGAFASAALETALSRSTQLLPRDRALATEMVYGTLRVRVWLIERLQRHARKPIDKIDPRVLTELLVAAYQIFFLRIPAFAAVNEAVGAVRVAKGKEVAAFANAVLRKLATEASAETVDVRAAALASCPPWLAAAIARAIGEENVASMIVADTTPPVCLRVRRGEEREGWIARLREAVPSAEVSAGGASPLAILVRGAGRPQDLPGFDEGAWTIQEEGSQVVALSLGAQPGEIILDACAGRGNKTSLLAQAVLPGGAVDAADLHASKLDRLREDLARQGTAPRATYAVDWSIGAGGIPAGAYDRVLVDAPCSGTGTLRRRPDLFARKVAVHYEEALTELAALQLAIVSRAADCVRPGGTLLYAVCSVLLEEGEEVMGGLLASRSDLEEVGPPLRLLPHVHGTDGYFLATLKKR